MQILLSEWMSFKSKMGHISLLKEIYRKMGLLRIQGATSHNRV
jgi:hypothetical protein